MEEREALQLGSLLHDIGRLLQRTNSVKLTEEDRALESKCCPTDGNGYSHVHTLYTRKFFDDLWPGLFSQAETLGTFHHFPENAENRRLVKLLSLADRLSSGERKSSDHEAVGNPKSVRLRSLFSSLGMMSETKDAVYFPLLPLESSLSGHFPEPRATPGDTESYDQLWQKMAKEIRQIDPLSNFSRFFTQIHHVLERFAVFVPDAAYGGRADVSLFHHLKATAAIATCLYDIGLSEAELDGLLKALIGASGDVLNAQAMWLIGADISGIQDFIYGVVSRRALKGLRGRSAYLQLLTEAVVLRLLNAFNLPCSNLIYSGGGHFYLLAPNTHGSESILMDCQNDIDEILVRSHRGQLALCFGWEPLSYRDFLKLNLQSPGNQNDPAEARGGFSDGWNRLGAQLARKKRAKFNSLLKSREMLEQIMGPFPVSGKEASCDVCGEPFAVAAETTRCDLCTSFETLASRMARAESMSLESLEQKASANIIKSYEDIFEALGVRIGFFQGSQGNSGSYLLNRTEFTSATPPFLGFRFLARHTPMDEGDIATLEDLADRADGIKKWGVLRADVDHLGKVFREGLADSDQSLSRISMLSYQLSLFFSAHIESLAMQPPFRSTLAVIYSGGDDLFTLGSWSVLKKFADKLHRDFTLYTGGKLTISTGVFIAPTDRYPVAQAGKLAGDEERTAKNSGRNRFSLFGQAIPWSDLPELQKIEDTLVELMGQKAPRSLFSLLYQAFDIQCKAKRGEILLFPVWRLLYALRRLIERQSNLGELVMDLEKLLIRNLWLPDHAVVAVRLAEYLTRKEEKGGN